MGYEFELKFRADKGLLEQLQQNVEGQEQTYRMHTTYYDAYDGSLSAKKYTLRRRMENDTSVCTLKVPASGDGRGEFEVICDTIEEAVPTLCKLSGLPELEHIAVTEVCGARFTRIAKTFTWQGTTMELALDKGELYGGGRTMPLFEVEIELKEGAEDAVRAFGAFLSAAYGLVPETRSKFRRGLSLYRGE